MEGHGRPHHPQQFEGCHGQTQAEQGLIHLFEVSPLVNHLEAVHQHLGQEAVDQKSGRVLHEDSGLFELFGNGKGSGQGNLVGLLAGDDFHERQNCHRIEKVESHHP